VRNLSNAAFTPDTCSPDTSCIHLYRLPPSTCILYRRQNCQSRRHVSTCIRIQVSPPGYLYAATRIWCKRVLEFCAAATRPEVEPIRVYRKCKSDVLPFVLPRHKRPTYLSRHFSYSTSVSTPNVSLSPVSTTRN